LLFLGYNCEKAPGSCHSWDLSLAIGQIVALRCVAKIETFFLISYFRICLLLL